MRTFSCVAAAVAISLLTVSPLTRADEEKVPLDKLPEAVVKAVKARFPDAKLVSAEKETEDGKTVYEVALTNKDQKIEVTVTTEGEVIEIEKQIAAKDLPEKVAQALQDKYPKAEYKTVEEVIKVKDKKDQPPYYEVLLVTAEKKKLEVVLDRDGKITKEEDKSKEKE